MNTSYKETRHLSHKFFDNEPIAGMSIQKYVFDLRKIPTESTLDAHQIHCIKKSNVILEKIDSNKIRCYHFAVLSRRGDGMGWKGQHERFLSDMNKNKEYFFLHIKSQIFLHHNLKRK